MDWLTFIAAIIKAAAWPGATLAIALIFRTELRALLAKIRKGKVGPAEFEFEQDVKVLTEQAPMGALPPPPVSSPTISLATTNPRAAIVEAWLGVETAVQRLAHQRANIGFTSRNPSSAFRFIENSGLLTATDGALYRDLRALRNQAAHDPEFSPSPESVIEFVQLAQGLKGRLESALAER